MLKIIINAMLTSCKFKQEGTKRGGSSAATVLVLTYTYLLQCTEQTQGYM